jgi:glycosyltransferase involved in cell wall biosynthesis
LQPPVNVLYLHSQTGFGAESAIHAHLMRKLDRRRFRVHVACPAPDGANKAHSTSLLEEIDDILLRPTHFAPSIRAGGLDAIVKSASSAGRFALDFAALGRYVRRENIRIIHGTDRPRDAAYAVALGRLTGAKSIVHVHVKWSEIYTPVAKWCVRNADAVFGISRYVTGTITGLGTPSSRVHTILNSIDPSKWDPNTDGRPIREEFGISPTAPLLVSVSRLFSWKGQRELLRALAMVRAERPDTRLLVVGADAQEVHGGSFTDELKGLARELDIAENVTFTGPRTDIPSIMAACDVYTMPSFEEPFGLVFLEAMAMQRPVAALNNGGTPEVVEHGRSGLLSDPSNVPALAANILTLISDAELRARMGAYGRSRVVEYFNSERMAADAARAYDEILGVR